MRSFPFYNSTNSPTAIISNVGSHKPVFTEFTGCHVAGKAVNVDASVCSMFRSETLCEEGGYHSRSTSPAPAVAIPGLPVELKYTLPVGHAVAV